MDLKTDDQMYIGQPSMNGGLNNQRTKEQCYLFSFVLKSSTCTSLGSKAIIALICIHCHDEMCEDEK